MMKARPGAGLAAAVFLSLFLHGTTVRAQSTSGEPDADPTGNAGVLKANVTTGCGYEAHTGNASRSVTDLHVPGALGAYGLDFTRHYNSGQKDPSDVGFVSKGWSHSWHWSANYDVDVLQSVDGGPQTWVTYITIDFPDGRSTKYAIFRGQESTNGWGPPYNNDEVNGWTAFGTVADHLKAMAPDGSNFWLFLADGGSVHFVGTSAGYEATQIFDPHGYRTDLEYDSGGRLIRVAQESGGRFLTIEWVYKQVEENGAIPVIGAVQSGGAAGIQRVEYNYSPYQVTQGNFTYTWYAFTDVTYLNDLFPGQASHSTYTYHTFTGLGAGDGVPPALEYADDKRYAGPMHTIRYTYRGSACHKADKPQFEPYPNARFDYYYATANAVTAELSGDTGVAVSSLTLGCFTGIRKETSGLGGWRNLCFGRSAGSDPGAQYIGDWQTGHWNPPEAGQGNYQGYHLCKVTDFYTTANPPDNVPFDFQHYYQDYPWRIWDGKGHITQLTMVQQPPFGLDGAGHVAEVWHRDDNTKRTYNWTDPGASASRDTSRIPNTYNHWLFSQTDERHLTTTYRRDARRRITDITYHDGSSEHFTYNDLFNEVETHTLASGAVLHYQYDSRGLLIQEWNDVDGQSNATIYTYDPFDRVATVSYPWTRAKAVAVSVALTYNGRHQVVQEQYPATNGGASPSKSYEYDAYGNCTAITDEMGHRSTYTYDFYRRCTSYTEPLNAPDWEGGSIVAARRWDWIYDRLIDGVGQRDASAHTKNEWRLQIEPGFDGAGNRRGTARWHDLENRVTLESSGWIVPPSGSWTASSDLETHTYTYDENGQKRSYTDPQGRVTTYDYDVRNRLWKTNETVNTIPRTTETLYDETGNKTLVRFPVEAAGQRTQQWLDYDPFGQPGRFIDERGNTTNMDYWNWGPMKKLFHVVTHRYRDDGSMEDQPTTFYYDGTGRPLWTIFPDGSSELTTYLFGQVNAFKTRKNQTKRLHYDARGREDYHTWDSDAAPRIDRTWDDANRLTRIANAVSTVDFGYDSAGQVLWEGNNIAGSGNYTHINYLRYPDGAVSYMQYPNNLWVHHNYTARGQLKNVLDYNYGTWKPTLSYYYLADGKVNWQDYVNGVQTSFHYDGRGMVDWLHHHRVTPYQNLAWREYTRDARDRIVSWKAGSDNSVNPLQDGRGHRFAYDPEGQLTDAWYGPYDPANSTDGTVREDHFSYDQLGNRRGSNWQGWDGAINYVRKDTKLNQYRSWQPYSPVINYDDDFGPPWGAPGAANGVVMQDGYITASYNALNQPVAIWAPAFGSNFLWLGYDPLGRCVKRWVGPGDGTAPGGLRYFYYDGWNLIEDGTSPWNPEHFYVNGARIDEIVASYTWGVPSYHHYDANGNCMTLTNAAGNITEQYYYDAFGKPYMFDAMGNWLSASPSGNRFLFTGREYISELKLYDYRNRLYNPQMGRFLQPDPKEFAAGDYNLYRYCHNDPVNRNDPFGLEVIPYSGPPIPVDTLKNGAGLGATGVVPVVVTTLERDGTTTLRLETRITGILVAQRVKFHGILKVRSNEEKKVTFEEHEKGEHVGKDWHKFDQAKTKEVPTTRYRDPDAAEEKARELTAKFKHDAFEANKHFEQHQPESRWKNIRDRELPQH